MTERPTVQIPANVLICGDVVMGHTNNHEVMETHSDRHGTTVWFVDGTRDSYPNDYKVVVVR